MKVIWHNGYMAKHKKGNLLKEGIWLLMPNSHYVKWPLCLMIVMPNDLYGKRPHAKSIWLLSKREGCYLIHSFVQNFSPQLLNEIQNKSLDKFLKSSMKYQKVTVMCFSLISWNVWKKFMKKRCQCPSRNFFRNFVLRCLLKYHKNKCCLKLE